MSPADSASLAGVMPEASGDSSSGTFGKQMKPSMRDIYLICLIVSLIGMLPMASDHFGRKLPVYAYLRQHPESWNVIVTSNVPGTPTITTSEAKEVLNLSLSSFLKQSREILFFFLGTGLFSLIGWIREIVINRRINTLKSEQASPANHRPFGTSGMSPADSASRAGDTPEASGDS